MLELITERSSSGAGEADDSRKDEVCTLGNTIPEDDDVISTPVKDGRMSKSIDDDNSDE